MTELKAKKKHHYVPQFYLKKWLTLEGLWIKNKINHKEKIYPKKSTKDIAEENNFYGIEIDDVVWDMLAYRFEDDTKSNEIVRIVMNGFWNLKIFDDIISKKIWAVNHDESLLNSAKKTLDHLKNTYLEDAYSHMESEVSKKINIFNKVQDSNLWTPLPTDTYSSLIVFFAFQLFRTKDVRSRLENNITDLCLSREDEKIILTENQKETFFKCLLYIFSIQFCMRIESLGFHMVIHKNRTKQAYLTSDCPANYYDKQKHPHLPWSVGIMPLSPKLLIEIRVRDTRQKTTIEMKDIYNTSEIQKYNRIIDSSSHNFVFARKRKDFHLDDM